MILPAVVSKPNNTTTEKVGRCSGLLRSTLIKKPSERYKQTRGPLLLASATQARSLWTKALVVVGP